MSSHSEHPRILKIIQFIYYMVHNFQLHKKEINISYSVDFVSSDFWFI